MFVCADDVLDGVLVFFAFGFLGFSANGGLVCGFCLIGVHICCWEMVEETRILCLVHLPFTVLDFFFFFFYQYFKCSCLCSLMFLMILLVFFVF
jgi:hypothetical protein